jgi:hypothetical protein
MMKSARSLKRKRYKKMQVVPTKLPSIIALDALYNALAIPKRSKYAVAKDYVSLQDMMMAATSTAMKM